MRPGSLVERYRRCGKPTCHCARKGAVGHGPSWSLTHAVDGKTITKIIPAQGVELTRKQVAEYQRFRALAKDLIDTSDQLCDTRLRESETASDEAVKKGASKTTSRERSTPKSERS
jgi:hypothetical protein